jgi:hypothetical protein
VAEDDIFDQHDRETADGLIHDHKITVTPRGEAYMKYNVGDAYDAILKDHNTNNSYQAPIGGILVLRSSFEQLA